jgi:hypothetical protein
LEEWPLSLDAIAMCSDRRSLIAMKCRIMITTVATCLSLQFDRRREPRPQWHESQHDFSLIEGIVAKSDAAQAWIVCIVSVWEA